MNEDTDDEIDKLRALHRARWEQARALGGEPHLEWTFAWHHIRAMLFDHPEVPYFYEQVGRFDDLRQAVTFRDYLREIGAAQEEHPEIRVGFNVYDSIFYARDGRLAMPAQNEVWRGRHSVVVLGMADPETLIFANSWGKWGDGGIGYMSRDYFERHADHASIAFFAERGLSPSNFESFANATTPDERLRVWMEPREQSRQTVVHNDFPHELVRYRVVSSAWHCPVDVIELWARDRRFGWLHLFHKSGRTGFERQSVIRELFVRGPRGVGLGSVLERAAVEIASVEGSTHLLLDVEEADGTDEAIAAATAFALARGYDVSEASEERRPIVVLRGRKSL